MYSAAMATNLGPMRWHGPHHETVKSNATSFVVDFNTSSKSALVAITVQVTMFELGVD